MSAARPDPTPAAPEWLPHPAKRGSFAVLERHCTSRSPILGPREWVEYLPAKVVSVTRAGVVRAVEIRGRRSRDLAETTVLCTELPAAPLLAALGNVFWKTLEEARAAVRAAAAIIGEPIP